MSSSNHGLQLPLPSNHLSADFVPYGPQSEYPFLNNILFTDSTDKLLQHIIQGTSVAVSDGSFFPSHDIGAFGWIITTPSHDQWIKGGDLTPGPRDIQCAYRSELAGQAAIASFYHILSKYSTSITISPTVKIPVRIGCDCLPTIPRVKLTPP